VPSLEPDEIIGFKMKDTKCKIDSKTDALTADLFVENPPKCCPGFPLGNAPLFKDANEIRLQVCRTN
jgi:hypothetical protein